MAFSLTIMMSTNTTGTVIQVVIHNTPPELPGQTTTPGHVLLATNMLLLFSPVSVCFTSCDSHTPNHTTMGTLQTTQSTSSSRTTLQQKIRTANISNHTHASHLLPTLQWQP